MSRVKQWFKISTVEDILSVSCLEALGPIAWLKAYVTQPSLKALLNLSSSRLEQLGFAPAQVSALINRPKQVDAAKRLLERYKIKIVTIDDKDYPELLKQINDPPLWLFYRGSLECLGKKTLTVVGTRKPSNYALTAMKYILPTELVSKLTIISGLAYGIDKASHELALNAKTLTAAVLAGGLDTIYPSTHYRLAESIIENRGVLISEYPPLSRPQPWKFPVRNRILAGLSPATLVVEAAIKSGSLTTAKSALDYNREILAVPNEITRPQVDGTNFLIKNGATLIDSPHDLALILKISLKNEAKVDKYQSSILDLIADNPLTVDIIVQLTKRPIEEILGILTQLEISGAIYQSSPGYYKAKK